jgi:alkylation response protein AidB-like acyl-CoA dehydrogenase
MYDYAYEFRDEELALRQAVKKFAENVIKPVARELEETGTFSRDIFRQMGDLGLFRILIAEEHGGLGLGETAFLVVMEEICKVSASFGVLFQGHSCMTQLIASIATTDQRERYLERLLSADLLAAAALTEPQAGSDLGSLRSSARLENDHWIVNAHKIFISNGGEAGLYVVAVRTEEAERHAGISLILVEAETPGFSTGRIERKMGLGASPTAEIFFNDCRVPAHALLGMRGRGFSAAEKGLNLARLGAAAAAIGLGEAALEASLEHARERKQFGKRIFDFQAIEFMIVEMATRLHTGRLMMYHAARKVEAGKEAHREVAMTKYAATDAAMQTTVDAVQVFGGAGYMKDYPVERLMRDAKIWQIVDGTNQIQRLMVGRSLDRFGA